VDRDSTGEIWEIEGFLAVTSVSGSYKLEEDFVLGNWERLPFAKHPAVGSEIARK
jgi:hypothetical protein